MIIKERKKIKKIYHVVKLDKKKEMNTHKIKFKNI